MSAFFMRQAKPLLQKFEIFNNKHRLLAAGDSVLIAVSGGPDSVALLYFLNILKAKYKLTLRAAHLNHRLNQAAARRYQKCVREHAAKLNIPLVESSVSVRSWAKRHKRSLEEAGRMLRYEFLGRTSQKFKFSKIATAHTLDDQAETILMRLIRGSGIKGLSGIPAKRAQNKAQVIRPFLDIEKAELLHFLKANRIRFCADPSNKETVFFRNKIRRQLLPQLKTYNPGIKRALAQFAHVSNEQQSFIHKEASRYFEPKADELSVKRLRQAPPALFAEIILNSIIRLKGHTRQISFKHLEAVRSLVHSGSPEAKACVPGFCVRRKGSKLRLESY